MSSSDPLLSLGSIRYRVGNSTNSVGEFHTATIDFTTQIQYPHRCGQIILTDSTTSQHVCRIGLGSVTDVRLGVLSESLSSTVPTFTLTLVFLLPPTHRGPETEIYRGAPVPTNELTIAFAAAADARTFFTRLVELLRANSNAATANSNQPRRRLLTSEQFETIEPKIPTSLIATVESGVPVTLYSRGVDGLEIVSSLIWFNWTKDTLFFAPLTRVDDEGETVNIPADEVYVENELNGIPLEALSDIFVGPHDPIWSEVAATGVKVTEATTLTLVGSQHDNPNDDGFPTSVELHAHTSRASNQQLILDAIQYASDWSEGASGEIAQADVVVHVADEARAIAPEFYCGSKMDPIEDAIAASSLSIDALLDDAPPAVASTVTTTAPPATATATETDPLDVDPFSADPFDTEPILADPPTADPVTSDSIVAPIPALTQPLPIPTPAPVSSPSSAPSSSNSTTHPSTGVSSTSTDPDLSTHSQMACLVEGLAVTLFTFSTPNDPFTDLLIYDGTLKYVHDRSSNMARIAFTKTSGSVVDGPSGWTNFADLTDVFLGKNDELYLDPNCVDYDDERCMSIHTLTANVDGTPINDYRLHIATSTPADRDAFLESIQYGLTNMGSAVESADEPNSIDATKAADSSPLATGPQSVDSSVVANGATTKKASSRLKQPSMDLTAAAAQATAITTAALDASKSATTPKSTPSSAHAPTLAKKSSTSRQSSLPRKSQSATQAQSQSQPQPVVYTPPPVTPKAPEPKLSASTKAKLSSLSQPKTRNSEEEEDATQKPASTKKPSLTVSTSSAPAPSSSSTKKSTATTPKLVRKVLSTAAASAASVVPPSPSSKPAMTRAASKTRLSSPSPSPTTRTRSSIAPTSTVTATPTPAAPKTPTRTRVSSSTTAPVATTTAPTPARTRPSTGTASAVARTPSAARKSVAPSATTTTASATNTTAAAAPGLTRKSSVPITSSSSVKKSSSSSSSRPSTSSAASTVASTNAAPGGTTPRLARTKSLAPSGASSSSSTTATTTTTRKSAVPTSTRTAASPAPPSPTKRRVAAAGGGTSTPTLATPISSAPLSSPSPMPVSSPAVKLVSPSDDVTSSSPEFEQFEGEEGLLSNDDLSMSSSPPVHDSALPTGVSTGDDDDEVPARASSLDDSHVYDPDQDDDLDLDLDFSRPSPPAKKTATSEAPTGASLASDTILTPPQFDLAPPTDTATDSRLDTNTDAPPPPPSSSQASITTTITHADLSTPLQDTSSHDVPTATTSTTILTTIVTVPPSSAKSGKVRMSMFGEELDDHQPSDDDDDLDDLFGGATEEQIYADDFHQYDETSGKIPSVAAASAVAAPVASSPPMTATTIERIPSMDASHVSSNDVVTSIDTVDDDFVLVQAVGSPDVAQQQQQQHQLRQQQVNEDEEAVKLPVPPLRRTEYQRAVGRLEAGCTFTSFALGPDTDGALRAERIFLWLDSRPPPLPNATEPSVGALFWCSVPSASHPVAPTKQPSDERRIEIVTLADIWQGRQVGLLLRPEFEAYPDTVCVSFVAAADPDGPPSQTLDLVADRADELTQFMEAFHVMLQGPIEEEDILATHPTQHVSPVTNGVAETQQALTSATTTKLPARISVPFLPESMRPECVAWAPIHLSTAPIEPHSTKLRQFVGIEEHHPASALVDAGATALRVMRAGFALELFARPSSSSSSSAPAAVANDILPTRHWFGWRPKQKMSEELQPYDDTTDGDDLGTFTLTSVRPSAADTAVAPSSRAFHPLLIREIVLGKFGGGFESAPSTDIDVACASHARCLTLLFADGARDSIDLEFDHQRELITFLLALRHLLAHAAHPHTYAIDLDLGSSSLPSTPDVDANPLVAQLDASFCGVTDSYLRRSFVDYQSFVTMLHEADLLFMVEGVRVTSLTESAVGSLAPTPASVHYIFENHDADGPFGSLYWATTTTTANLTGEGEVQFSKNRHQRLELRQIRAIQTGTESAWFERHAAALPTAHCLTLIGDDDLVRWSFADSSTLDTFLVGLQRILAFAGRSLVRDATEDAHVRVVTGDAAVATPVTPLTSVSQPVTSATATAAATTLNVTGPNNVVVTATMVPGQTFVPPAHTPDYLEAVRLLGAGRSFYSYYYIAAPTSSSSSSDAVVGRSLVCLFFSSDLPPSSQVDVSRYDLPLGEDTFPALYKVAYEEGSSAPTHLRREDMTPSNILSMHELTDLYLGVHHAIFHAPSTVDQFVRDGRTFAEEECLTIVATGTAARQHAIDEWNLEAIARDGLDQWLEAINRMLPLHLDSVPPTEEGPLSPASDAPTDAPSAVPVSDPTAIVETPMSPMSPSRPLRSGAEFVLLRPTNIGSTAIADRRQVKLFFLSASDIKAHGIDICNDAAHFPVAGIPQPIDEFMGCLYFVDLPSAVDYYSLQKSDLRADQCVPLHALTDIYHGRETNIWKDPSLVLQGAEMADDDCFSLVTDFVEWNFHTLAPSPTPEQSVVATFLVGLQALLQSGGRDIAEDGDSPVSAADGAIPSSSGWPTSPTAASLITPDATIEFILQTMGAKQHSGDGQLHATGMHHLHTLVNSALSSSSSSDAATDEAAASLISLGVGKQVIESMLAFPRLEKMQADGCAILWLLATSTTNELALTQVGALTALLTALQNHASSLEVVTQATGALRNLAVADGHAESIGRESGLEVVLAAMKSHPHARTIQEQGLGTIASLCALADLKTQFASLGGVEFVLHAMREFDGDCQVHEAASAALRNIAANHPTNKSLIASLGGIEVLLASIRRHANSASNLLHAVGSLWNLTANAPPNKTQLVQLGGIHALTTLLSDATPSVSSSPLFEAIVGEVCGTLRNLSTLQDASKSQLGALGATSQVIRWMKHFATNRLIQEQAAALLFNTSGTDGDADRIIADGGIAALVSGVTHFIDSRSICEDCCGALWMLTRTPAAFHTEIAPAEMIALADRVLEHHPNAPHATGMRLAYMAAGGSPKSLSTRAMPNSNAAIDATDK